MIRNNLRQIFHRFGYDLTRKPPAMTRPRVEFVPGIEFLAALVRTKIQRPTFVQIGAYDGQANDPLVDVATELGWRGVLVEPQPRAFAKLQAFHARRPQFFLKRAAIGPNSEPRLLYSLRETAGLPDWA